MKDFVGTVIVQKQAPLSLSVTIPSVAAKRMGISPKQVMLVYTDENTLLFEVMKDGKLTG
jgi:hypothetical protein